MTVDIGEPKFYAQCSWCRRNVGGPYFDKQEANARTKEHIANLHQVGVYSTYSQWTTRALKAIRTRGSFQ